MIVMLIAATILEKAYGTAFAVRYVYSAPYTTILWGLLAVLGMIYMVTTCGMKQVVTFGLHLSFVLILCGAFVTHISGTRGSVHLRTDIDTHIRYFETEAGGFKDLGFEISLKDFRLERYPGSAAPMDFVSTMSIIDGDSSHEAVVSMNNIYKYKGFRFYQSGYDRDGKGSTLSITHDPYGIALTYTGYICMLVSMVGFFFQKGSRLRALLDSPTLKKYCCLLIAAGGIWGSGHDASASQRQDPPQTISIEAAEAFDEICIYYQDRICPLQTFARDFTAKLCGKTSYKGLTAGQVLAGWLLYHDEWVEEPMIKIKGEDAGKALGTDGKYAALSDFTDSCGYKLERLLLNADGVNMKNIYAANEKFNLISMVSTGSLIRIYPAGDGTPTWYSTADIQPFEIRYENDAQFLELMRSIKEYQSKNCPALPADSIFKAEKLYNSANFSKPLAMFCMTLGIIAFLIFTLGRRCISNSNSPVRIFMTVISAAVFSYLTLHISLRWYISGHIPLSNGFETMQFMAWSCLAACFFLQKKFHLAQPFGILICGFAMLVSMMGEANPRITQLMPVLQSPLLSIHVMVIMVSYTLFAFMMLNGFAAIILHLKGDEETVLYLKTISNIMLYPAVFLLTAGIFIGAVWANVSWGRYWGWDPKEVWALITMMTYSFGLHQKSLKWFEKPMNFHIFCILAFLCVLITYFGVNFLLGGLHSYA